MNLPHFQASIFSNPVKHWCRQASLPVTIKCYFRRKTSRKQPITHQTIPARDRVIDFGKYKGKMLGTLPSSYLKWVCKNLRARDFEEWSKLADQVLQDPIYKDRIEWEFAENVLSGNQFKTLSSSSSSSSSLRDGAVSELMEISERFGWDNKDKLGWSNINFELLGTSKGGRIPRLEKTEETNREALNRHKERDYEVLSSEARTRRMERRERQKMRREAQTERVWGESKSAIREKSMGSFVNDIPNDSDFRYYQSQNQKNLMDDETGQNGNIFPGREALLRKAYNRRRFLS